MAKRKRKISTIDALSGAAPKIAVNDAFANVMARTGEGMPNLMNGTVYPMTRLSRNYNLMNSLYRGSWIVRRVIDTIPKDMLKNWVHYTGNVTPEQVDLLEKAERKTKIKAAMLRGLNWGRLYGGAAALMLIDGQDDMLDEPLEVDSIMPGDFKGLLVVDRWAGCYPHLDMVDDIDSPDFGLPKYYEFRPNTTTSGGISSYKVHHSRIVRFIGDDLPEWERQAEMQWGSSKIETVFDELKKRDNTSANIAGIVFQANLKVLMMDDLGELIAGSPGKGMDDFYKTIQAQNWLMNNFGTYIMSKDDDFKNITSQYAGLDEIYEKFMLDVCGAAQIPMTKLFGRSPAGMNATGESDLRNYYDIVEQEQEAHLRPALEKLLPVLCMSALGEIPDDIEIAFNPVMTPPEKDADIVSAKSESVFQAHDRGLISDQLALKELKQIGDPFGIFTNITDEDINKADAEVKEPELDMSALGFGNTEAEGA